MATATYKKHFDLDSIISGISKYLTGFDKKRFREAFDFAEKAHKGQFRKDNKTPYISHSVETVEILAGLHADEDILISALLHDVPEDTKYTLADVERLFGKRVAFLVSGITKLSKVHYQHNMPGRQVESLKKLFLHSAKDPRVILIKLADRLHNMRTLQFVKKAEKRSRISRETLEIFVPMANLLGIQDIKSELEDLCFKNLFPPEYKKLDGIIDKRWKKNRENIRKFKDKVSKALKKEKIEAEIYHSKQSLYTIYRKLSENGKTIDQATDRIVVRIVVDSIPNCYEALGIVHSIFTPKPGKFKDYIANPKMNKYRSLHTMVFGENGILTEVQIRTRDMHLEAKYGIASIFFSGKGRKIDKDARSSWVNKIIELEKDGQTTADFLEELKMDVFKDRIFAYTPKGGQVDLPRGASVLDFAYSIHTKVGEHAVKADVNGNLQPVTTILNTGDVVDVVIDDKSHPKLSWLSFVKTNLAKNKIRQFLKDNERSEKINDGKRILQKEFDIADLGLVDDMNFKKTNLKLGEGMGKTFKTYNDLLISVGEGEIPAIDVVNVIKKPEKLVGVELRGVKVNIKIVATNRFALLRDIYRVLYRNVVDLTFIKAWTSNKYKNADFNVQVTFSSSDKIRPLFDELEQIEGVKYVYRIPYSALYLAYTLLIMMGLLWVIHPFILRIMAYSDFLVYSWLFVMFIMIMYLAHLIRNHIPLVRNTVILWVFAFSLPVLATGTLIFDLFYFDYKMSWWILISELAIIYLFLARTLWILRKNV